MCQSCVKLPDQINGLVLVKGRVSGPLFMQNLMIDREERRAVWVYDMMLSVCLLQQCENQQSPQRKRKILFNVSIAAAVVTLSCEDGHIMKPGGLKLKE